MRYKFDDIIDQICKEKINYRNRVYNFLYFPIPTTEDIMCIDGKDRLYVSFCITKRATKESKEIRISTMNLSQVKDVNDFKIKMIQYLF